jgi:hypothetical protein
MPDALKDPRFIVTLLVLVLAGIYDLAVTFFPIHIDRELMTVILTSLNANGLVVAVSYWLGSSKSSSEKDQTISKLLGGK